MAKPIRLDNRKPVAHDHEIRPAFRAARGGGTVGNAGGDGPRFSIIVPVYNRRERLQACLSALDKLDYPKAEFEIIVVDDGSPKPIEETIAAPANTTFIRLGQNEGPAAARNHGARCARGSLLAFLDSDCLPCARWLKELEPGLRSGAVVGGAIVNGNPGLRLATTSMTVLDAVYAYYNVLPDQAQFLAAANFALPASTFHALDGFDRRFVTSEDRDLCARCLESGFRLVYAPEAKVVHDYPVGPVGFWRRHFGYGRGSFRFRCAHGEQHAKFEPAQFYWRLLSQAWRINPGPESILTGLLVAASQAASALGYFTEWLDSTPMPVIPKTNGRSA